jgi:hypothetical protein
MTSKHVLKWIDKRWTSSELKGMLERARQGEPALRVLAHKSRTPGRTREPANIPKKQKHLLVNAFASALYMVTKGGPNDGEAYYQPILEMNVHEEPARMLEVQTVAEALKRWA